ncbi:hypothetical protein [Paenibacillus sp. MBLB4367]|uniref:hypothetical protein n=1 Tax=Paenibacillus sp. MBLB4367 TaxID=3384767 RepID=UPI0039080E7F
MRKKWLTGFMLLAVLVVALAGCGGPKADVIVFVMTNNVPIDGDKMAEDLKAKVGETPTTDVLTSPMFSMDKLFVELAAGDSDLFVVPKEQYEAFAKQGGLVILDELFKPEDYPGGVVEAPVDTGSKEKNQEPKLEKHLYGIPMNETKWLKDSGYRGKEEMYAFVHPRSKQVEETKDILKKLSEK